jgi:peptidyl-prolyl cis-trans isomerase A (cyclophilin A)
MPLFLRTLLIAFFAVQIGSSRVRRMAFTRISKPRTGTLPAGSFFDKAPKTVANFVGLASGEQAWLDGFTGAVRRQPFYDGITFHRIVGGFVIQGGLAERAGDRRAGYHFRDEFDSTLRHSKEGILSMANSGPHSNGSQFFITLAATPGLNDVHSVLAK